MDNKVKEFLERFPFMSLVRYGDQELVGIIQNSDQTVVTMYVYNSLKDDEDKMLFVEAGEEWWWGSNRVLHINLVVGPKFKKYSGYLRTYNVKDFEIIQGTSVSLQNIITKRIKRRQIQLVQKL